MKLLTLPFTLTACSKRPDCLLNAYNVLSQLSSIITWFQVGVKLRPAYCSDGITSKLQLNSRYGCLCGSKSGGFSCGKQCVQLSTPDISGYDCYSRGDGLPVASHAGIKSLYLWPCEKGGGPLINNTNLVVAVIFGGNQFEESVPCHTASRRLWKLWQRVQPLFAQFIFINLPETFKCM